MSGYEVHITEGKSHAALLEAGIRRALDHLGSAREEDSLDRREQYRAEAELERVL